MKKSVLALALMTVGALVGAPNAAAEDVALCEWAASKVVAPEGYDPKSVAVQGTDSHGNYVGYVRLPGSMQSKVAVWTDGKPRVAHELDGLGHMSIIDENSSGTVLLQVGFSSSGRYSPALFAGAHKGEGTITELVAPDGYHTVAARALNNRGDVLANARSVEDGRMVTLLYSTGAAAPIVIDTAVGIGLKLNDDGSVLLEPSVGQAHLWRDGELTPLTMPPGGQPTYSDMRSGKVIGAYQTTWPYSQAVLWDGPSRLRELKGGATATAINGRGLIAGHRGRFDGPAGVWLNTRFLGDLPLPEGVTAARELKVIGDDNSIFGRSSDYDAAIRWTCG